METDTLAHSFPKCSPRRSEIYEIYDRELMAIIWALEEWRHYIQGSSHTTTILLDHKNLTYYRDARKLNRRQARWSLYLSEFDIKLVHMAGTKMIQSDNLSRRPDYILDNDTDNEDITMLPDDLFIGLIDVDLQNQIAKATTWIKMQWKHWQHY